MGRPRKRQRGESNNEAPETPESMDQPVTAINTNIDSSNVELNPIWPDLDLGNIDQSFAMSFDPSIYTGWSQAIPWSMDQLSFVSNAHDPVSTTLPSDQQTTCNCLVTTLSALQTLQGLTKFHFPSSMGNLRNTIASLTSVVNCAVCPKQRVTAFQNSLLLQTTLTCIGERFHGLVAGLNEEHDRLVASGERPQLRIGDPNSDLSLHTGRPDCPMGFNLSIDPVQWKTLAQNCLISLVKGPGSSITELIEAIETRQRKWHSDPMSESLREHNGAGPCFAAETDENVPQCVANLRGLLQEIESLTS
jgi:hypothetical protein